MTGQLNNLIYCFHGFGLKVSHHIWKESFKFSVQIVLTNVLIDRRLDTIEEHQDEIQVCFATLSPCKMFQMPEDITLVCHLSRCTTIFWHCVIVDALITIGLLEEWKQSCHRCLIQNASLVTCCSYLFQREKAHRQQPYPNLHFKINLKNNRAFHFHL